MSIGGRRVLALCSLKKHSSKRNLQRSVAVFSEKGREVENLGKKRKRAFRDADEE